MTHAKMLADSYKEQLVKKNIEIARLRRRLRKWITDNERDWREMPEQPQSFGINAQHGSRLDDRPLDDVL